MAHLFFRSSLIMLLALLFFGDQQLYAAHGVSIDGTLKYGPDFRQFDYVDSAAKSGGNLTLNDFGSFDKLNPYTLKGIAPHGLGSYVFETLAVPSLDEPFAEYGLIAQDIELAADKRSVTFTLNPQAKFSDGSPVRPEDVQFSLEVLKSEQAHPFYQLYFQDIEGADILDTQRIRFRFAKVNRELHMIACQLPIFSKAFYTNHPFDSRAEGSAMQPPLGTGPYVVSQVVAGKSIVYKKKPDYWAKDHPTRRFMFNFDTITVKIFKDLDVSVEGFKAGEFDLMVVNIAKQWETTLSGRRFNAGELVKKTFPHHNNMGIQGFVFNTRRPIFSDPRVRQALWTAFDFQWTNRTLFFSHYTRNNSFFSNSDYAATGLPSPDELTLLEPWREQLPKEVFTKPLSPSSTDPPCSLRTNIQEAKRLLEEAGWIVKKGKLTNARGEVFRFEVLLDSSNNSFERVFAPYVQTLKKLGIEASTRGVDQALYADRLKNFDFDMAVTVYGQSQSPGNEQRDFWTSDTAEQKGSRNLAGIKSPVVDALVSKVIYAQSQEELVTACRALDRVLWYGYYLVPNWYLNHYRLAYNAKLRHPKQPPRYFTPYQWLDAWWIKE